MKFIDDIELPESPMEGLFDVKQVDFFSYVMCVKISISVIILHKFQVNNMLTCKIVSKTEIFLQSVCV